MIYRKIKNGLGKVFGRKKENKGMQLSAIIFIGYRNILVNKMRSVLTIGGVAIGIGIITFLICIGFGMQKMVINEVVKENPVNIIDISNGNLENFVSLNEDNIKKIKNIKGVQDVQVSVNTGGKMYQGESQTDVIIFGITNGYLDLVGDKLKIIFGKMEYGNEGKIMISSKLAGLLGFDKPKDIIGKKVKFDMILSDETNSQIKKENEIKDNEAEVVAVFDDKNNISAYFSYKFIHEKFGVDLAQRGKIKIDMNNSDVEEMRKNIELLGFETESVADVINDINLFFWIVRIVLIIFGIIIMSISAMGMLNTLSVSLLQRTKEVGILKALGSKRQDIFRMFIFEAAIISLVGGAMGFLGGYGLARLFNEIFNILASQRGLDPISFVYIPMYFVIALVTFIFFLGLSTGIMPARRAARIHALDALRYE